MSLPFFSGFFVGTSDRADQFRNFRVRHGLSRLKRSKKGSDPCQSRDVVRLGLPSRFPSRTFVSTRGQKGRQAVWLLIGRRSSGRVFVSFSVMFSLSPTRRRRAEEVGYVAFSGETFPQFRFKDPAASDAPKTSRYSPHTPERDRQVSSSCSLSFFFSTRLMSFFLPLNRLLPADSNEGDTGG